MYNINLYTSTSLSDYMSKHSVMSHCNVAVLIHLLQINTLSVLMMQQMNNPDKVVLKLNSHLMHIMSLT